MLAVIDVMLAVIDVMLAVIDLSKSSEKLPCETFDHRIRMG